MLDGPLVFVDIDTQRDFLEPSGGLFIPGSEPILAQLGRLTDFAPAWRLDPGLGVCARPR